jgi:hypothetical protein
MHPRHHDGWAVLTHAQRAVTAQPSTGCDYATISSKTVWSVDMGGVSSICATATTLADMGGASSICATATTLRLASAPWALSAAACSSTNTATTPTSAIPTTQANTPALSLLRSGAKEFEG